MKFRKQSTFIIEIPELHWSKREVEADSIEEAFRTANADAAFKEVGLQFDHSFLPDGQSWEGYSTNNEELRYRFDGGVVNAI